MDRNVRGTRGVPGINTTTPHQIDIDSEAMELVVHEGSQVTKPNPPISTDRYNMAASSNTASCAAPVILSVWVLSPRAPATPMTAALLSLSVLMGGGWFFYLGPLVHHQLPRLAIYVYLMRGGSVDTWPPSRTPDFSVYVCPGGYYGRGRHVISFRPDGGG